MNLGVRGRDGGDGRGIDPTRGMAKQRRRDNGQLAKLLAKLMAVAMAMAKSTVGPTQILRVNGNVRLD